MKRFAAYFLILCLLLGGCAPIDNTLQNPTDDSSNITESTGDITESTEDATESTEEVVPPTEPPVLFRHPLTGEALDEPYIARPTAVVVNNIKKCLPQHGIADADMIYEIETEGGITRLLAIFSSFDGVGKVGPIRSARTYFNNISTAYDSPLIHCGGSVNALKGMYDDKNTLTKWVHINQFSNGAYFYRDTERKKNGYAHEHTLFTTGELLTKVLAKKKMNITYENGNEFGLQFADVPSLAGSRAFDITVTFRGKKTTTLTYSTVTGQYEAAQYGSKQIDGNTGAVVTYRNVLVLQTEQWRIKEGSYTRSYYDLIGEGNGYFACDGKIIPIKWSRPSVKENFSYTFEDGTPVTLGVGRSYIGIISTTGNVEAK